MIIYLSLEQSCYVPNENYKNYTNCLSRQVKTVQILLKF